jgi:hypothetical protein
MRCSKIRRTTNDQCTWEALSGEKYCARCLGGRKHAALRVGNIYAKQAGVKLSERLKEVEANADKRMGLIDEIDVARTMAMEAVEIYSKILDTNASPELKAASITIARDSLNSVATLLVQAKKLDIMNGAALPTAHVDAMITKVLRIIEQEAPDHLERIAARFDEIRLPTASVTISVD